MSTAKSGTEPDEVAELRQQLLYELAAERDSDWVDETKPGSFGCHELLDRTSIAADTIDRYILAHPACVANRDWFALAERAVAALNELYQLVGAAHLGDEEATEPGR